MVQQNTVSGKEIEKTISDFMLELGIPAHLRGYQFLRSAVEMCVENMELVGSVTKLLYPDLAKMYQTTDTKIERAIRNAIEVSWNRGNYELFEELFGYSNSPEYTRPTNSEYIAVVADYIRLKNHLIA